MESNKCCGKNGENSYSSFPMVQGGAAKGTPDAAVQICWPGSAFSRSAWGNRAILSQIWSGFVNLTVPLFGILTPVNWQNPGFRYSNGSNKDTLQPQIALGIRRNAGGNAGTGLVFL
jgi:hypothetical protein